MQFIEKTKGNPYKIERIYIANEFTWLPNGDLMVLETIKRKVFLKMAEAIKVKKQMDEKLGFHKYEISDAYKQIVQEDIDTLQRTIDEWTEALKNKIKQQDNPAGEQK